MLSDRVEEARERDIEAAQVKKETRESLEHNFTPNLARRLSRQFIEQTRHSIPRSPSVPRDSSRYCRSPTRETPARSLIGEIGRLQHSATSDQTEYRGRSLDRGGIRRTNSLLEPSRLDRSMERHSPRRSISLFDDDDDDDDGRLLTSLPKHVMTLGRKYKDSARSSIIGNVRRDNFYNYRTTDKIQEEPGDDAYLVSGCKEDTDNAAENGSVSESTSVSNSNANLIDTTTTSSGISARSCETSPTESSSNLGDYTSKSIGKSDHTSMSFENRLLAAENLIKESKLKNLTPQRFNPNLSCNYKDTDKCDKEALITTSPPDSSSNSITSKRRSCIPSLRLRSGSLTRESSVNADYKKSFTGSQDALAGNANQERSILSKFFRGSSKETESKNNNKQDQKPKQHRISRFLRPDFFDTPREESQYVKEKEAQKAAENERRKSRFMRRKSENKEGESAKDEKICKEQKNEMNALQKDKLDSVVASSVPSSSSEIKSKNEDKEKAKVERVSGAKSGFLHSLEKKLERLRVNDEMMSAKSTTINANDRKERECSAPPIPCSSVESTGAKKTLSVENLSLDKNADVKNVPSVKGRVTSVLGLFKTNADAKQNSSGRSQNAIMSRLKRSPPKCAKSVESEEDSTTSKIPTKFARADNKPGKKIPENKRSPEKVSECKRSPPKEKPREKESIVKEKKCLMEKQSRELKKAPEKIMQLDSSADKAKLQKAESPKKLLDESDPQKIVDNKHAESIISGEDKKLMKTKKNINSLGKNGSIARIDKSEDIDKKTKKPVKLKESTEKDDINGTKKKRIVRVVKKVVKKSSDSSESKSEEKERSSKPLLKKRLITKKEKSPEASNVIAQDEGNNLDDQIASKSPLKRTESDIQKTSSAKSDNHPSEHLTQSTDTPSKVDVMEDQARPNKSAHLSSIDQTSTALQNTSNSNVNPTKQSPDQHRPSRAGLKLDLSKIPQHTFRHTTPKRDSPKSGSPKANPAIGSPKTDVPAAESGDKLIECLSRMTHHANITGNKIIIDKPLRARDVAELKREVTECVRIMENHIESRNDCSSSQTIDDYSTFDSVSDEKPRENAIGPSKEINDANNAKVTKESPSEECLTSEMFSPEEPESFDSWSICSADLNHNRGDLHSPLLYSPTSPTSYSLFTRGDSSESVIDRIRRRSFYSRFNDRKRPSLTAPPPGVTSATLPRRFSLNSSRERERSRLYYGISRTRSDNRYGLYDEVSSRKSPIDRERYSDVSSHGHYSPEAKSLYDHYVPSSSYDSSKRYVKSPTSDLCASRVKYHSTDVIADDLAVSGYKNTSRSSLNDGGTTDFYCGRSASTTLPKKYGSTVSRLEPKSVEYYEEILSPSNPDYLSSRDTCRSPLLDGYLSRCENGYHNNGNIADLSQFGADRQRSYADRMADVELAEGNSKLFET